MEEETACLVTGIRRKEFAVKVCGHYDAPGGLWVFGRDHISETLHAVRRSVIEQILFDVPIQFLESIDNIMPNLCIVRCVWSPWYEDLGQMGVGITGIHVANRVRGCNESGDGLRGQRGKITSA